MIWITTQAKFAGQREIKLGDSCRAFLKELGIQSTGGKNGSIGRLRKQLRSLLQYPKCVTLVATETYRVSQVSVSVELNC